MENLLEQKKSIGNFLNAPSTSQFLKENLEDKRQEFVSNLLALCESDANLANCDHKKLMLCAMNATALGLPLNKNLGYAYIIAYNNVPSFQISYKGLIQLALRTGQYRFLNACEVRESEIIRNKFTSEIKVIGENKDGEVIGYMACLELMNGFKSSLFMTEQEIEKHALKYSKMYASDKKYGNRKSKWSDPDTRSKMAIKTVLKGLLGTYGIMSTEIANAISNDNNYEIEPLKGNRSDNIPDAIIIQEEPSLEKVQIA